MPDAKARTFYFPTATYRVKMHVLDPDGNRVPMRDPVTKQQIYYNGKPVFQTETIEFQKAQPRMVNGELKHISFITTNDPVKIRFFDAKAADRTSMIMNEDQMDREIDANAYREKKAREVAERRAVDAERKLVEAEKALEEQRRLMEEITKPATKKDKA